MTSMSILSLIYILCHTLLTILTQSQTISRIPLGSSLIASPNSDSSWKSPSGDFAFGLHRLDDQNLYLLSIWFDKIPDKTIVWYANGDNPAPVRSKVELTSNGRLRLTNPNGDTIWESQNTNASYGSLLDTGNFILAGDSSSTRYLWQTFDHPTDTILPTQQLQINGILSSRETTTNFSTGRFQLRLVPEGDLVLTVISNPPGKTYEPYYRSNTADDSNTMNSGNQVILNETGILYVVKRNGRFVNLTSENMESSRDFYFRATLDFDGLFTLYVHPRSPANGANWDEAWRSVWYEPQNICMASTGDWGRGPCGFNTICALDSNGRPSCECLPGFSLMDPSNPYSGCKQDIVQSCNANNLEGGDNIYEMRSINNAFWPTSENYEVFPLASEDECSKSCFGDCNCIVAVIKEGICSKKKLPLSNGQKDRDTYGKALIKMTKNNNTSWDQGLPKLKGDRKDQSTLVLVLSILFGASLLLNFVLVGASSIAVFLSYQKTKKLNTSSSLLETNLRVFTYEELKEATNGFREQLGRGAFGTVYKGVITNSSTGSKSIVAIKKLEKLAEEGDKEFKTEASVIAKFTRTWLDCWGFVKKIICCRKNVEMEREKDEEIILTDWAYDCYKARKLEKLIGDEDETRSDMKRVERLVMAALWCIQEDPSLRPSMKKVVQMLEGVVEISLPPCPSPFLSMSCDC
ncbi:hypothetical protein L2E82_39544 [Cichorium intybus]|uniref:Uncharacterized protein n=1 Tax=Cichorium intybus TaxID=13427 RepID=A0ACB9AJA6_CICIN|nr:hypothetical protein L2E82_39544 [Cichorium intybus]